MAGYDAYSKSNNALKAETAGLLPASRIKVKGVSSAAIRLLDAEEWHHTSKEYRKTDYYSVALVERYAWRLRVIAKALRVVAREKKAVPYPKTDEDYPHYDAWRALEMRVEAIADTLE